MARPEITEGEVSGELATIYKDIRKTLGTPVVNLLFRELAAYDPFLQIAWPSLRGPLLTSEARLLLSAMRESGELPGGILRQLPALPRVDNIDSVFDLYNSINPMGLISAVSWRLALDTNSESSHVLGASPKGAGAYHQPVPPMVDLGTSDMRIKSLLKQIASAHGLANVPSIYRILAQWPEWLNAAWPTIAQLIVSKELADRCARIKALAVEHVEVCPNGPSRNQLLAHGLSNADLLEIENVLDRFIRSIPVALVTGLALKRALSPSKR